MKAPSGRAVKVDTSLADFLFQLAPRVLKQITDADFYSAHPWLFAGIGAIARNVYGVPWEIREGKYGDVKGSRVLESHPWTVLFDKPCPILTRAQFWEALICYLNLPGGECFVVKEGRMGPLESENDIPTELWPLPGQRFTPTIENDIPVEWVYDAGDGKKLPFKPWQLVHLKKFNPRDPLRGLGPATVAGGAVRRTLLRDRYNEAFLVHDATPNGAFVSEEPLTTSQKDSLQKKLTDDNKGPDKKGRFAILSGGLKWVQIGSSHVDMAFKEQGEEDRDTTLGTIGVPKSEVGLEQDVNMVTGAGHLSRNVGFWIGTILPTMTLIEESLWPDLFRPFQNGTVWGQFNRRAIPALRGNRKELLEEFTRLQESGYTQREASEYLDLDLPPTEISDLRFIRQGLQPVDAVLAMAEGQDEEVPDPMDDAEEMPAMPEDEKPAAPEEEAAPLPHLIVGENIKALEAERGPLSEVEKVKIVRLVRGFLRARGPKAERYWSRVVRRTMIPAEPKFARRTRRYFMELRAEQLRRVKKLTLEPKRFLLLRERLLAAAPADLDALLRVFDEAESEWAADSKDRDTIEQVLFPRDKWDSRMKAVHHPVYVDVVSNAMDQAFVELGGNWSFDIADTKVVDVIAAREDILVKANGTIRRLLAREIEEGVKNGETIAQIQDRIKARFNSFSGARALTIARTEVAGATNSARHETFKGEGVEEHQWITARDEAVRESHREIDGTTVRIGAPFPNGLKYPGEVGAPAGEVINCRCVASPVVK